MPRWMPLKDRLMAKLEIDPKTGCWVWQGCRAGDGSYGCIWSGGRNRRVHAVSYELHCGPIPEGLVLDHKCRNRLCANPDHLEPVTLRENILRGVGITAMHAAQSHCMSGHLFDEANTYRTKTGSRACVACRVIWRKAYEDRKRGINR